MEEKANRHQIFDKVFLAGCSWHIRLVIPLIREVFKLDIPDDAIIESLSNEQVEHVYDEYGNETLVKRITDAIFKFDGNTYHFECESKNDGQIMLRISQYDMNIAFRNAEYDKYSVNMELPETAVIFLRNHRNIPDEGAITYRKGNQELTHKVPFLKVKEYSLEDLSDKHLYILLPFYLMRYEYAIKHTKNKYGLIENEARRVYDVIECAYKAGLIGMTEYENILSLCKNVIDVISKDTEIEERLVEAMGYDTVILTAEERGIVKATVEHIKSLMEATKISFDEACNILNVRDKELYRNYIR